MQCSGATEALKDDGVELSFFDEHRQHGWIMLAARCYAGPRGRKLLGINENAQPKLETNPL